MIEFKGVSKSYKNVNVLKDISFKIEEGDLVCLIGESGCGKTTTLKMINKLITPTTGEITINKQNIKNINDIKLRRKMGYVIQQTGLFSHMTIKENIEIIAKIEKMSEKKRQKRVKEITIEKRWRIIFKKHEVKERFLFDIFKFLKYKTDINSDIIIM